MEDKLLRSIKFPGLSNTYNIPQLIPEYNPEAEWYCGNFCIYEGRVYRCSYYQQTEDDPEYTTGPFNSNYWENMHDYGLDYIISFYDDILGSNDCGYQPYEQYFAGDIVFFEYQYWICIRSTDLPAGEFNENFWQSFHIDGSNVYPAVPTVLMFLFNRIFLQSINDKFIDNDWEQQDITSLEWDKVDYDSETGEFTEAFLNFPSVDAECDYVIISRAGYRDDFRLECYGYYDLAEGLEATFPFIPYGGMYEQIAYIPSNTRVESESITTTALNGLSLHLSSIRKDSEGQYELLDDTIFGRFQVQVYKISKASGNLADVNKEILQDYTEVYKSLSQDIIDSTAISNDYTDTVRIPLNQGNVALQFINIPFPDSISWNDIDIELRLYSNKLGTRESINLKNRDKHIFIINKNMGQNGELVEWDEFKLRLSRQGTALTSEEKQFVNSTLNILRKPRTQSIPNPTLKNDEKSVQQFVNLARSYLSSKDLYNISQPTCLENNSEGVISQIIALDFNSEGFAFLPIDAQTFIGLCLRGLGSDNTPYSLKWTPPNYISSLKEEPYSTMGPEDWLANTKKYNWAINPYRDDNYQWYFNSVPPYNQELSSPTGFYNECGMLAKWMVDKGWLVDTSGTIYDSKNLDNIEVGDIIFFAEKLSINGFQINCSTMMDGYDYRGITHAAICTEKSFSASVEARSSDSLLQCELTIITVPSFMQEYLHQTSGHYTFSFDMEQPLSDYNEYTNTSGLTYCLPSKDTLALVCRPNLSSTKPSQIEIESQMLGLHTIPKNIHQLNIIKNCRLCTDIEWTPIQDFDRPMPVSDITPYRSDVAMIDGKFKQGITYKGMPWTNNQSTDMFKILKPEQFISTVGIEGSYVNSYSDSEGVFPGYGWHNSEDFLNFVFGREVFHDTDIQSYFVDPSFSAYNFGESLYFSEPVQICTAFQHYSIIDLNLELGDVIAVSDITSHSTEVPNVYGSDIGIVTDLIFDEYNNISQIEVSLATRQGLIKENQLNGPYGNLICRRWFTPDELVQYYCPVSYTGGAVYFRYKYNEFPIECFDDKNIKFGSDGKLYIADQNLLCVPYYGNRSLFVADNIHSLPILLNIDLEDTDYEYLTVYHSNDVVGGYSWHSYLISDLPSDPNNSNIKYIDMGFLANWEAGNYYEGWFNIFLQEEGSSWSNARRTIPSQVYGINPACITYKHTQGRPDEPAYDAINSSDNIYLNLTDESGWDISEITIEKAMSMYSTDGEVYFTGYNDYYAFDHGPAEVRLNIIT